MRSGRAPDTGPGAGPSVPAGDRAGRWACALVILLTPLAWLLRFVQDDAFISFRYARHLAQGAGLVFNPGQTPVEGYTNFLWTLLLALPELAGFSPVVFVYASGLVLLPCALWGTYRLGRTLFDATAPALVAVALLGTNYSFVSYATGGLETMLQTTLIVWTYVHVAGAWRAGELTPARACAVSVLAGLAGMTRLDSAALLLPAAAMCAILAGRSWRLWLCLAAPVGAMVVGWFAWKWSFYAGVLPNTLVAKSGYGWSPVRGAWYLACFALSYGLPLLAAIAYARRRPLSGAHSGWLLALALAAPAAVWGAYIVYTGGDFMEFRFIVPAMPYLVLLIAAPAGGMSRAARTAMVVVAIAFSALHGVWFDRSPLKRGLESIPDLQENLYDEKTGWVALGLRLGDDLGGGGTRSPVIALTPVGAAGYYSGLPVVDMIGLNDGLIAREGAFLSRRAGHRKIATVEQLGRKGVHVVIGHPHAFEESMLTDGAMPYERLDELFLMEGRGLPMTTGAQELAARARVVVLPSTYDDAGPRVYALQLAAHPVIDDLVQRGVWSAHPIAVGTR